MSEEGRQSDAALEGPYPVGGLATTSVGQFVKYGCIFLPQLGIF
jgi:hypothetical protein